MTLSLDARPACQGHNPELWFPHPEEAVPAEALALCAKCPVRHQCAALAIKTGAQHGVYAGLRLEDPQQRQKLRRRNPTVTGVLRAISECERCGREIEHAPGRTVTRCRGCAKGLTPAAPVVAHINNLRAAAHTYRDIAVVADLPKDTIANLVNQPRHHVNPDVADRVMAVRLTATGQLIKEGTATHA